MVRSDGKVTSQQLCHGKDAMVKFFKYLEIEPFDILEDLKMARPLEMTQDDWTQHRTANTCCICNQPFQPYSQGEKGSLWKVKDHDHLTEKY